MKELAGTDADMTLYDDLGLGKDASQEEVKSAYRKRVARCHPDVGGTREEFERVHHAYMVLIDPERRARYDETGETDTEPNNSFSQMTKLIVSIFDQIVTQSGGLFRERDLIAQTRDALQKREQNILSARSQAKIEKGKFEELLSRLRYSGNGPDVIGVAIRQRIRQCDDAMVGADLNAEVTNMAIAYLDAYGFYFDNPKPNSSRTLFISSSATI